MSSDGDSGGSLSLTPEGILNAAVNVSTFGVAGYDKEEGFGVKQGIYYKAGEASVKGLKDVTGASALEKANEDARKRLEEEKAGIMAQREEQKNMNAQQQLQASRSAGSVRGATSPNTPRPSSFSKLGSDERDFLGL